MGIFDKATAELYVAYKATARFTDRVVGGTPSQPNLIDGWLKTKHPNWSNDHERMAAMLRTLRQTGAPVPEGAEDMDLEAQAALIEAAAEALAGEGGNVFKRDATGLYLEGRQVKAAVKETINIRYAGLKGGWGPTRKGGRGYISERLFVFPSRLYLTRERDGAPLQGPDGVAEFVGHVSGPQGSRSTLTRYQYAERPWLGFYVAVDVDAVPLLTPRWPLIWATSERQGLGALRSQGAGVYSVEGWDEVPWSPDLLARFRDAQDAAVREGPPGAEPPLVVPEALEALLREAAQGAPAGD